jgi:hypothetical protein
MKFINVCGYGNTGCTVQADYLSDYEGVYGALSDKNRNQQVTKAPYQEFGILKCLFSIGGMVINKLHQLDKSITVNEINYSLNGKPFQDIKDCGHGALIHLNKRAELAQELGASYQSVINKVCKEFPKNYESLNLLDTYKAAKEMQSIWCQGVYSIKAEALKNNTSKTLILGLKNDPTGAYPLLSSLIPNGITSAILRHPFDTCWDFNRHYKIDITKNTVIAHCKHYNSQLNAARSQIQKYRELIGNHYFVHEFEKFVTTPSARDLYRTKMIGLDRLQVNHYFRSEDSSKNIGIHTALDQKYLDIIESECLPNYNNFKELLKSEDMFL